MTRGSYAEAVDYVRSTPTSGLAQFALLTALGLTSKHRVLEIGCGVLHLAKPLLALLDERGYHGIDPNDWLRHAARDEDQLLDQLCRSRHAQFSSRTDFDAREAFNGRFDVVVAHSVLSHAGYPQLDQFTGAVARALGAGGWALVSLNLEDVAPNMSDEWTYPRCVSVARSAVVDAADRAGLTVEERPELRDLYRSWCPTETHNWLVLR